MTAVEYLKEKLCILANKFPQVTIKYGFDVVINTHIVELTPQDEYYYNTALDDSWIPISLDFMQHFPNDYISFVSNDSTLRVEEPQFSFKAPNALLV